MKDPDKEEPMSAQINEYEIMIKNKKVASIVIESGEVAAYSKLPIGLSFVTEPRTIKDAVANVSAFQDWCSSRVLMMNQKHAKKICNALALSQDISTENKAKIALAYHCSTLNDNYWVRKKGDDVSFEEVSLFFNTSQNILTPVSLKGKTSSLFGKKLKNWSDIGTDGTLAKSWIRENGEYYLYKECDNADGEVLAGKILDMLKVSHVDYERVEDEIVMTKCKCFTSDKFGFVPYHTCIKEFDSDARNMIRGSFLTDYANLAVCTYLIGNEDLHDKNWGVLINDEGAVVGLAPMFDFDGCFLSYQASADLMFLPECRFVSEDGRESLCYEFDIDSSFSIEGITIREAALRYAKDSTVDLTDFDYSVIPEKFRSEFQKRAEEITKEQT